MTDSDEWLFMSLGVDEAAEAMKLSEELRRTLYSDIYTYGPAAARVMEFSSALNKANRHNDVWLFLGKVYGFMNSRQVQDDFGYSFAQPGESSSLKLLLGRWVEKNPEISKLWNRYGFLAEDNLGLRSVVPLTAPQIMMFFTGEHLFPARFLEVDFIGSMKSAVPYMDEALRALDLAPLGGRLA